ncbi:MAG: transketolase family protein [Oscillospiraceae bacterium]|jgi:transketolase|nr:transketolase family protein [Oscillospiraceae bacterium]
MEMRKVLFKELEKIMRHNSEIIIINADLAKAAGLSGLNDIFPDRCFNVGVAEQNMAGVAAGMATYGFIPCIFSFAPFVTRRICDQIAISICYAQQNVKLFGLDPGIAAEHNGGTHMSFEDIGVLRSIPNIIIFEPCDEVQFEKSILEILNYNGPVYIRMFRKETPKIFDENYKFDLLKSDILKKGEDISIFCTGIMVHECLNASKILDNLGISSEIINIHTIKPIDKKAILDSVRKTKRAITAENHNVFGGLFSAVSEILSENFPVMVKPIGIHNEFGQVGDMSFLKEYYGLTAKNIVENARRLMNKR